VNKQALPEQPCDNTITQNFYLDKMCNLFTDKTEYPTLRYHDLKMPMGQSKAEHKRWEPRYD